MLLKYFPVELHGVSYGSVFILEGIVTYSSEQVIMKAAHAKRKTGSKRNRKVEKLAWLSYFG